MRNDEDRKQRRREKFQKENVKEYAGKKQHGKKQTSQKKRTHQTFPDNDFWNEELDQWKKRISLLKHDVSVDIVNADSKSI